MKQIKLIGVFLTIFLGGIIFSTLANAAPLANQGDGTPDRQFSNQLGGPEMNGSDLRNAFTFQGVLTEDGEPFNGTRSIEINIFK
jgi:hypothetical protein